MSGPADRSLSRVVPEAASRPPSNEMTTQDVETIRRQAERVKLKALTFRRPMLRRIE
jgi:hypothetical protein